MRTETRRQRYDNKITNAKKFPVSIATINFMFDENLGFVVRSAGCFGLTDIHVIGAMPEEKELSRYSGTLSKYIKINQYNNPTDFLTEMKAKDIKLISLELCDEARNIEEYEFNFDKNICIVVGHERTGVPAEILANSEKIYIPMGGIGYSLNTSQAGNIAVYEAIRQYKSQQTKPYLQSTKFIEQDYWY